jgi:hypothetical protein
MQTNVWSFIIIFGTGNPEGRTVIYDIMGLETKNDLFICPKFKAIFLFLFQYKAICMERTATDDTVKAK